MTHQALYRKWRPQRFSDVIDQHYTVQTLKNAIAQGEIAHAYLFAGPRGTGKTSVARILAKAVNCPHQKDGEPCNTCSICESVIRGNALDVIEIDGASNRGIDQIRQLREEVKFSPAEARYKVYIIDEIHMLTNEAFNALLKTLEEPPPHVVFVFATTEPHKVPPTVLSRCQAFEFKTIPQEQIEAHLKEVAQTEKIAIDDEALVAIARHARGALRDALVLLEQLVAYKGAEPITAQDLYDVLGLPPQETIDRFLKALLEGNSSEALRIIGELAERGRDLELFVGELIHRGRDRLIEALPGGDASGVEDLQAWTTLLGELLELKRELHFAFDKRVFLELKALELAGAQIQPPSVHEQAQLHAKTQQAETQTEATVTQAPTSVKPEGQLKRAKKPEAMPAPAAVEPAPTAVDLEGRWQQLLKRARRKKAALYALLTEARPRLDGSTLFIEYASEFGFHKERLEQPENLQIVQKLAHELFGREVQLVVGFVEGVASSSSRGSQSQSDKLKEKAELVQKVLGGRIVR
jgi:DNA polymerase-3 subunit gamma/tau